MSNPLWSYEAAAEFVAHYADRLLDTPPARETIALQEAAGRVLAAPVLADRDQPSFPRSIRDGVAGRAAELSSHAWLPITGATRAGDAPPEPLAPGSARILMTGAPLPPGADCVAMIEHLEKATQEGQEMIRLTPPRTLKAGDNFVPTGAQGRLGDQLLPAGAPITFAQTALAASCGLAQVEVYRRPRVAILATGDEIVPIDEEPKPGQIRNSNAIMLAALVSAAGGEPWILPQAADTAEALEASFLAAAQADMMLATGGVSAGKYDLVEPVLEKLGATFHFTGLRIQPGKPLVFGELPRAGKTAMPFFGLPGNPISSAVTFLLFAQRIVAALGGDNWPRPRFALATMGQKTDRTGKAGLTRFLPAYCDFGSSHDGLPVVDFAGWHGSGDLTALASSNCFLVVPEEAKYHEPGETVRILLY